MRVAVALGDWSVCVVSGYTQESGHGKEMSLQWKLPRSVDWLVPGFEQRGTEGRMAVMDYVSGHTLEIGHSGRCH